MYEYKGRVLEVCAVQTFASGFTKRELVVAGDAAPASKRPPHATFNFKYEDIAKLEGVNAGDAVTVRFEVDGREWTDPHGKVRHFTDLVGVSVDVEKAAGTEAKGASLAGPDEDEACPF